MAKFRVRLPEWNNTQNMAYEFYQNTLTVPAALLYEDGEILTKPNYDKLCRAGKMRRAREGKGLGNYALVEFDTIPERFRLKVIDKLGYPPKKQVQHQILKHFKTDYEAVDYFATYQIDENRTLSPEHQEQYVADAQMLFALDIYIKEMKAFRSSRGGSITKVWQEAAKAVSEVKEQTGHKLPGTDRRLRDKLESFQNDGYKSLISEKFLGNNASKIVDEQQEAVLRKLLRQYQNFDSEYISKQYNVFAEAMKWAPISGSTVSNYKKKFALTTDSFNSGKKKFTAKYKMQVKRKAPEFAMSFWTLDGWKAELLYQKFENGKTTFHNRLTIEVVLDAVTKYPVGYAIADRENPELIKAAMRNAFCHTEELFGFKHKVNQIQADNYSKSVMFPIYKAVAKNFIPVTVGNAQAKIIEPWFNYFNKNYCRPESNWSGYSIKSDNLPSENYLNLTKKQFPTEEEAYQQLIRLIEKARADTIDAYMEAYEKSPADLKTLLPEHTFFKSLGVKKEKTTKMRGVGIEFDVQKISYSYDTFDLNFRRHADLDWDIFFIPERMEKVLAYNSQRDLSFMLEEKAVQPMDLYGQSLQDEDKLKKVFSFNKSVINEIMTEYSQDAEILKDVAHEVREIDDTLAKFLLTDSLGQHKNHKNAKRLQSAQKMIVRQEAKEENKIETDWNQQQEEYLKQKVNLNKYLDND